MNSLFDSEALREIVVSALSELGTDLVVFVPRLLGALLILLIGWVVARVAQAVAAGILSRAGLDAAGERLGVDSTLRGSGIEARPSMLIARLLFWLLMLTFLLSAVETLGLSAVTMTIDRLIGYLPNVIAAALIVLVGLLTGRFAGNLVSSAAAAAQLPYARHLGSAARAAIGIAVIVLSLEQLGVDAGILMWTVITLLAAGSLGLGLSFALGSREVVGSIIAGYYLRKSLREGGTVVVDGREGVLQRVGPIDTVFRGEERSWSVPNAILLRTIVDRLPQAGGEAA